MSTQATIHADDFGLTRAMTDGILETIDQGSVTSVSLMANGYAFDYAVEELKQRPHVRISVHVDLVEGRALSNPADVSSIVHKNGCFKKSFVGLALSYYLAGSKKQAVYRKQVANEVVAQIRKVQLALGAERVTRVDSHLHVHMIPWIWNVFVFDVATKLHLESIRLTREPLYVAFTVIRSLFNYVGPNLFKNLLMHVLAQVNLLTLKNSGLVSNTYLIGVIATGRLTSKDVESALATLNPAEHTVEILFHPGRAKEAERELFTSEKKRLVAAHYRKKHDFERQELLLGRIKTLTSNYINNTFVATSFFAKVSLHLVQILKFGITGASATAVHLSIFALLTNGFDVWYVVASALGFLVAFGVSFTLQKYWTFQDKSHEGLYSQLVQSFVTGLGGLLANIGGVYFLVELLGFWPFLAQLVIIILVAAGSFFIYKFVIFRA